jgi:hypothetical protein
VSNGGALKIACEADLAMRASRWGYVRPEGPLDEVGERTGELCPWLSAKLQQFFAKLQLVSFNPQQKSRSRLGRIASGYSLSAPLGGHTDSKSMA